MKHWLSIRNVFIRRIYKNLTEYDSHNIKKNAYVQLGITKKSDLFHNNQ